MCKEGGLHSGSKQGAMMGLDLHTGRVLNREPGKMEEFRMKRFSRPQRPRWEQVMSSSRQLFFIAVYKFPDEDSGSLPSVFYVL